jgi:hypothetical protein
METVENERFPFSNLNENGNLTLVEVGFARKFKGL